MDGLPPEEIGRKEWLQENSALLLSTQAEMKLLDSNHDPGLGLGFKGKGLFGKNGRLRKKFIDEEAELSGSEEEVSDDEDERGLNFYEKEDGDDEEFDEEDVKKQIERAHLKHLLDQDDRVIRLLQEEYLERGDLEDGKQRTRKFKWTGLDDAWGDEHARMGDSDDEGAEDQENEEDVKRKVAEIEKKKWLSENSQLLEDSEEHSQKLLFQNSKFLKLGKSTMKKIETVIDTQSSFIACEASNSQDPGFLNSILKAKIKSTPKSTPPSKEVRKDETDSAGKKQSTSNSQLACSSPDEPTSKLVKRGSFLARDSPSLSNLAKFIKVSDGTSNVKSNSRNFVFSVVTPPEQPSKQNKGPKRPAKANSQGTQPKKMIKVDRSFNNLDDSSKDASIFKWM